MTTNESAKRSKPAIMGGMFGLPEKLDAAGGPPPVSLDRSISLANGRCCLALLIELLSPPHVWLPAYLCPSIIAAVRKTGVPFSFFEVDYDLRVSPGALSRVGRGDLVEMIDYFGFQHDRALMNRVRESGAWVIEDACQAMLTSGIGSSADFVLITPRKFAGVPDGGILISNRPEIDFRGIALEPPPTVWWTMALNAAVLRREFDLYGGDRRWFELYRTLEENMPMDRQAMSDMSKILLATGFDYAEIGRRRVENYQILAAELSHLALYPSLAPGVVPLGFPVRIANRDEVRTMLYAHNIYPPVQWPFKGILPEEFTESYRLLGDFMMLPCDQRYDQEDMQRLIRLVGPNAVPVRTKTAPRRHVPASEACPIEAAASAAEPLPSVRLSKL